MRVLGFAWKYLWSRPLAAGLNLLLLTLGLASITFLLLAGQRIDQAFERDLAGIDAVVGAKGSPMQLILSGVLHLDVPTGNIPLAAVSQLQAHPQVARVIPLSLGDNLRGFRIVGTTPDYVSHYGAALAQGALWTSAMQAVLGAQVARQTGLRVGDRFTGSHGLGSGGHEHGAASYTVTGILAPGGSVLDRLVLTSTESVWQVHETAHEGDEPLDVEDRAALEAGREVTLALVQYKSPLVAVTFPRLINSTTAWQAASPAVEITRLLGMLGVGTQVLRALAGVLLLTAGLSVFIALWSAVRERRADLALLRMLGAPPRRVAALLLCEAMLLALLATLLGLLAGQGLMALVAHALQLESAWLAGGMSWPAGLLAVPALALLVGLLSALLPAVESYRINVSELLRSS